MSLEWIRKQCLALPHATEHMQWEALVFKIGGKIFAIAPFEPQHRCLSLKCPREEFNNLVERPGIGQAPYAARGMWVAFESVNVVPRQELEQMIKRSYQLVFENLPKKTQTALSAAPKAKSKTKKKH